MEILKVLKMLPDLIARSDKDYSIMAITNVRANRRCQVYYDKSI